MARQQTVLSVFVASPCDLEEERNLLEKVTRELNTTCSRDLGINLELIRWETDAFPSFGDDAQAVINEQIPEDYDIFIGLMWYRFGTPTKRAGSGTIEEFNRAMERHNQDTASVQLMVYFKDSPAPIPPSKLDYSQLAKVAEFRASLVLLGGLYWTFDATDDFANLIRMHLSKQVQAWRAKQLNSFTDVTSASSRILQDDCPTSVPLDEDEPGLIDLMEQFEDEFQALNDVVARIASAIVDVGNRMQERTVETNEFAKGPNASNRKAARRLVAKAAVNMDQFVYRMDAELPLFSQHLRSGMECLTHAATIVIEMRITDDDLEQVRENLDPLRNMRSTLQVVEEQIRDFQESVRSLPRMTSDLNKSKRAVIGVLQRLIDEFQNMQSMAKEVESTYESILNHN